MGESHLTTLSMENNHPSTLLSMDPTGAVPSSAGSSHEDNDRDMMMVQRPQQQQQNHAHLHHQTPKQQQIILNTRPPDINLLPLSADRSPPPPPWNSSESLDVLDVGLGTQIHDSSSKSGGAASRKCAKRGDSIWGAWFFFSYYFKPVLLDKSKGKVTRDGNGVVVGFDKPDLRLDVFLVQHDMENMYMWVFKERPENSLGKMQLRSFMNGHSRLGEPQFPFSVEKGFVRSHRMQRKQYRGLSNPQCVHGIEVVKSPNLGVIPESDHKKWIELTGRDINFSIPNEASDFTSWRNLPNTEFELDRPLPTPALKTGGGSHPQRKLINGAGAGLNLGGGNSHPQRKLLNGAGAGLNLGGGNSHPQQPSSTNNGGSSDGMELSPVSNNSKRRKDFFSHGMEEDRFLVPLNSPYLDHLPDIEMHHSTPPPPIIPQWLTEFTGVMKHSYGPVTAAKTIYEDEEGYLIMVSLPFSDLQKVKVSWRNTLTHGIVKISNSSPKPISLRTTRVSAEQKNTEKEAPVGFVPPELDPNTPSPIFGGSTGGLLRKAQVEEFYVITWTSPKEQVFEMPTGGAAIMREGPNLLKLARKEQCLALGTRLRTKYKIKYQFYRVFPNGEVQYLHPKDGVYPEKVNAGREGANQNMRNIGKNVSPIEVKFTGKQTFEV